MAKLSVWGYGVGIYRAYSRTSSTFKKLVDIACKCILKCANASSNHTKIHTSNECKLTDNLVKNLNMFTCPLTNVKCSNIVLENIIQDRSSN